MNWQLHLGKEDQPLTEQERRHLGAYQLFLESVDSSYAASNYDLDRLPPRGQRELIKAYHLWLDDPDTLRWCLTLGDWIFPLNSLRDPVAKFLSRLIPLD